MTADQAMLDRYREAICDRQRAERKALILAEEVERLTAEVERMRARTLKLEMEGT